MVSNGVKGQVGNMRTRVKSKPIPRENKLLMLILDDAAYLDNTFGIASLPGSKKAEKSQIFKLSKSGNKFFKKATLPRKNNPWVDTAFFLECFAVSTRKINSNITYCLLLFFSPLLEIKFF